MKRFQFFLVALALLALAGVVFAQQQSSSKTEQQQPNSYSAGWWCPMAAGWAGPMNASTRGPGWMMNNGAAAPRGSYGPMGRGYAQGPMGPGYAYGPMGPGMMYGPVNQGAVSPQPQPAPPAAKPGTPKK